MLTKNTIWEDASLQELRHKVYLANLQLPEYHLVVDTWGNVSGIDRASGIVLIKPSGVPYETMTEDSMVAVSLDGKILSEGYKPSSDLATHLELYRHFPEIGGVVHTHSRWATLWAQAGKGIAPYGTTHADYFYGEIPCTRAMTKEEIQSEYEKNTGVVITETFQDKKTMDMPAVLVRSHGPFTWGKDPAGAVHNAMVLEEVAMMAYYTESLGQRSPIDPVLLDKHFLRKHGANAYYGQGTGK